MADVSDERGQLFIVAALALALILVTLAMLLNTAIYTGNLATRHAGPGTGEVIEFENAADDAGGKLVARVNDLNNASYSALRSNYTAAVDGWSSASNYHRAVVGVNAHVTVVGTTEGTRIVQDTSSEFRSDDGAENWTLVTNTSVRNYTVQVDTSSLPNPGPINNSSDLSDETFRFVVTDDAGATWSVHVYTNSTGDVILQQITPTNDLGDTCTTTETDPTIDLTNATLAGAHCDALTFMETTDPSFDIRYENGSEINGTYSMVVDRTFTTVEDTGHYHRSASGGDPYLVHALYSAELQVTYRSPVTYYQTYIRVVPGEPDA